MKFIINTLLVLCLALLALAAKEPERQVIISYPKNTPSSVLDEAKKVILDAGGFISHEYHIIQAFAAKCPAKVIESVKALGEKHNVIIEEDQKMSINS
ncbi:hypothetical protein M409DRAFT_21502 [Zasmidium cellare ATCC 36951]|uniref:Inhibitor I9 domain-containing protein n=1 Tax=Zasmidium cellare ATCC 36951 TaxID=1080233 RepID=A0A6A6CRE3_ZASCE|nr:uncharacterized protein M409DRAFT_21502 [Zasmidium cellare ATCC 36951]KAF2168056.1 hypothetical protein M409DRAFT_21502 [Zasmidium cellare ATCC 36951]